MVHAQRPRVVLPGLRVVAAVHRGLPNKYEREGIVGLLGQSLHESRARLFVQAEMHQDQALPNSSSMTTGIDVSEAGT